MSVLALNIREPDVRVIHSEAELQAALMRLAPPAATYVMSFITLGIYWVGQQTQHHLMARSDRNAAWLHLAFLFVIICLPFSTLLLAEFITFRTALLFYWLNLVLIGGTFLAAWNYAVRAGLLRPDVDAQTIAAVRRRAVTSQGLYAFGAALCVFGTLWSIGFIFLVQLGYAVGPRNRLLARL